MLEDADKKIQSFFDQLNNGEVQNDVFSKVVELVNGSSFFFDPFLYHFFTLFFLNSP